MTKIRQSAKYECKKQDKSLYCFKLDEYTGIITKEEITHYNIVDVGYRDQKIAYFYKTSKDYVCEVYDINIDKLVNWKIHSFNPSLIDAYNIALKAIADKTNMLKIEYERYDKLLCKLIGGNICS